MKMQLRLTRRCFLRTTGMAMISAGLVRAAATDKPEPLKIGIRAASLKMAGTPDVFQTAARIPGIVGVELQTTAGKPNLRDEDTVRRYKKEAERCGMKIPALAGIWDPGVTIRSPQAAASVSASLRAAEVLGARVILAAFFQKDAPDMTQEASYGPIVSMLQQAARQAADAGVVIGLENSLSPADNKKLVDLVGHPAVAVYYDLYNMASYGHGPEAVPGIKLLGKERICMVHVKNGKKLIEEPGPIDWPAAFRAWRQIGYVGWYVYETAHESTEKCLLDTKKNNDFLRRHIQL
jgi:L-ribulose-5-phosphate 3-epimerase